MLSVNHVCLWTLSVHDLEIDEKKKKKCGLMLERLKVGWGQGMKLVIIHSAFEWSLMRASTTCMTRLKD